MVTQKDIAKKCKVSISAVSAAFKRPRLLSRETREKILAAAAETGYLTQRLELKNIGLVFNDFKNHFFAEFYAEIIYGILERLSELKLRIQIFNGVPEKYQEICDINGFLVIGNNSSPLAYYIQKYRFPYVLVDCTRKLSGEHNLIYFDNLAGVKQLTEFILNSNHKRIAIINGETDQEDLSWNKFKQGVEEIFKKKKLPLKKLKIYQADYGNIQTLEIAINNILSEPKMPTCIMCSNDWFAYHAYKIFEKYKVKIPEDISIAGFDGITVPSFVKAPHPKLTTVFSDRIRLGREAADFLIDILQNPQKKPRIIGMETELRIGNSVRRL